MAETRRSRLLLQYLEPSPAVAALEPQRAREHLSRALGLLPVTDLALGWRLRPELAEAVRSVVPADVVVWRWVPVFVDSGESRDVDGLVALGPGGVPPPPFHDLADFRFLCLDHEEVVEAGLERSVGLARGVDADGVLLDRIRWHSPSQDPAAELTCFCERSRRAASETGLDLGRVRAELRDMADSLEGRRMLGAALLGRTAEGALGDFLRWRSDTVTRAVGRLSTGLQAAGLHAALDVFTPALAGSVGQDLTTLGPLGEWSKSMTYFEALGPASMPFELGAYARWLDTGSEPDATGFLASLLGFAAPGVAGSGAQLRTLEHEASALAGSVGPDRSVVGLDAVEIPGVCDVDDEDLGARIRAVHEVGVGLSPCWELLLISERRTARIGEAWTQLAE